MRAVPERVPVFAFVILVLIQGTSRGAEFDFYHENVLGTSLELRISAANRSTADRAESVALEEIDRLSAIYSHYDPESEFAKFMAVRPGDTMTLSPELVSTLSQCEQWMTASGGAFNPAAEEISTHWRQAELAGIVPNHNRIQATVDQVRRPHWVLDSTSNEVQRTSHVRLTLNAIAKGNILDRVAKQLIRCEGIDGALVNIGGDLRIIGTLSAKVIIANPALDAIGAPDACSVTLSDIAVATSGRSERAFKIAGSSYSHIIDPRNGMPIIDSAHSASSPVISATVIAKEASTADAVATICNVLSASESLQFVNALPGVECLLITAAGIVATSVNWPGDLVAETASGITEGAEKQAEMLVEFEIAKSDDSRRYRRPYVAVWIEDKDGFPVKTLSLFLMQDNPGPRWHRDLRRWYADDQLRKLVDETDLIKTVSKPTRNPGQYRVAWDGKDDGGAAVKAGEYTLLIEAAREHGTYQLMRHKFTLGQPFETTLKPNAEIASARIRYTAK